MCPHQTLSNSDRFFLVKAEEQFYVHRGFQFSWTWGQILDSRGENKYDFHIFILVHTRTDSPPIRNRDAGIGSSNRVLVLFYDYDYQYDYHYDCNYDYDYD